MAPSGGRRAAVERVWRENRCLKRSSIGVYRRWIGRFTAYCSEHQLAEDSQLTKEGVAAFARWYAETHHLNERSVLWSAGSALGAWALGLRTLGEPLPPWTASTDSSPRYSPLLRDFAKHLEQHRGNPLGTIHKKITQVTQFKAFLHERGRRIERLRLEDIDAFVVTCRKRYARRTVADICSTLRGLVRFLHVSGRIRTDFSSSIRAPIVRQHEGPYRVLTWPEVRRILRAVDRRSARGRRDYALLLVMSTYGLGAGEAIRLRLDDVDWQAETIQVRRPKTGVEFLLPLMPAVARALAAYLKHGRPVHAQTRRVFVTTMAPHGPLACSTTVRHILNRYAQRAGVAEEGLGTHVLRHTHACRQMELGTRPRVIGDLLGHRDPESTSAYLRVAIERLRGIALPVPT